MFYSALTDTQGGTRPAAITLHADEDSDSASGLIFMLLL